MGYWGVCCLTQGYDARCTETFYEVNEMELDLKIYKSNKLIVLEVGLVRGWYIEMVSIRVGGLCSCCIKVWVFYYITQSKLVMNNNCVKNINSNTT